TARCHEPSTAKPHDVVPHGTKLAARSFELRASNLFPGNRAERRRTFRGPARTACKPSPLRLASRWLPLVRNENHRQGGAWPRKGRRALIARRPTTAFRPRKAPP